MYKRTVLKLCLCQKKKSEVCFCCIRGRLKKTTKQNKKNPNKLTKKNPTHVNQKPLQETGHTSTKKKIIKIYIYLVILSENKHNYKASFSSHYCILAFLFKSTYSPATCQVSVPWLRQMLSPSLFRWKPQMIQELPFLGALPSQPFHCKIKGSFLPSPSFSQVLSLLVRYPTQSPSKAAVCTVSETGKVKLLRNKN